MPLNDATRANLRRKSAYVDKVQLHDGKPLFSWVDLSLTELCNRSAGHPRACPFCPRIDRGFYPNQNLHMSVKLADKIGMELKDLQYAGTVVLCGFGEPLLHPQIEEIVVALQQWATPKVRIEVVTNGDFLGSDKIEKLMRAGVDYFVISLYDGPHQYEKIDRAFRDVGVLGTLREKHYLMRDRWHTEADSFGLKLTNRAGTVTVGQQEAVDTHRPCHYLAYQMTIDWNGDVLLCPQDWHKKVKYGNIGTESMLEIWNSKRMNKRRMALIKGHRNDNPCHGCNTDGTLHGFEHVPVWTGEKNE